MNARRSSLSLALSLALLAPLLAWPAAARAQRGIDVHLFQPSVDSNGYFSVERAAILPIWSLSAKLSFDYADAPLSVRMTDPSTQQPRRQTLIAWQLISHLGLAFAVQSWLEAVLDLAASTQSYTAAYGQPLRFDDPTLTRTGFYLADRYTTVPPPNAAPLDLRLGLKARAWHNRYFGLGALALVTVPIGDSSAFLGETGVSFRPTLVGDVSAGPFSAAINFGGIVRQTTRVLDPYQQAAGVAAPQVLLEVGYELGWSVAIGYRPLSWLGIAGEAVGLEPLATSTRDRTIDLRGGLQFQATQHIGAYVGAGGNVTTNADRRESFRVFAGVSWSPGNRVEQRPLPPVGVGTKGDRDGDGIPDAIDRCPDEPEDRDGFEDDDGCPDPDNDHDGIPDDKDHCPNEPEDFDGFEDSDGCPDLDNDGDGIPDAVDRCPNEPETVNGVDDQDGCPDSGGAVAPVELVLPEILFDAGKSALTSTAEETLNRAADRILAGPPRRIRIEGHADRREVAPARANELSEARALAVRQYLIKRGVNGDKLQAVGYGAARLKDESNTARAQASNRRVEFIVVDQ